MEEKKNLDILNADTDLDERIRNTANVLAEFAKENLDEEAANDVLSLLADIIKKDED